MRALLLAVVVILSTIFPAAAHEAIEGGGPLINGLLHPLLVPAHILALIGLGLWLGAQDREVLRRAIPAFAIALVGGLMGGSLALLPPVVPGALAILVSVLAAAGWKAPAAPAAMIAIFAATLIGFDSAPEDVPGAIGLWAGIHLILLNVINIVMRAKAKVLIYGARIAGAWIAAIALLMLALQLKS